MEHNMLRVWNKLKPGDRIICKCNTFPSISNWYKIGGLTVGKTYKVLDILRLNHGIRIKG